MISIKRCIKIGGLAALFIFSGTIFADTSQMNATLARVSHILNQINPLINVAEKEQDPNARVKFQFDVLRADIGKIQSGISQQINLVTIQPRSVAPLVGDYLPDKDQSTQKTVYKSE